MAIVDYERVSMYERGMITYDPRSMNRPDCYSRRSEGVLRCNCFQHMKEELYEYRKCDCSECRYRFRKLEERMRYTQYQDYHIPEIEFRQEYMGNWNLKALKQLTSGDDMNLVEKVKNLKLSAADKLLRKHNVVDAEGTLTETGQDLIWNILLEEYKDALVSDLKEVDAAEKAKK